MSTTRILIFAIAALGFFLAAGETSARGAKEGPIVYVEDQDLYYDSIVTAMELPPRGPFQQLYDCGDPSTPLCTEFGPGQPGHRGGRWWIDYNGNGEMDEGDMYFSCPLLGPGREEP
jgi:hypothetical protein